MALQRYFVNVGKNAGETTIVGNAFNADGTYIGSTGLADELISGEGIYYDKLSPSGSMAYLVWRINRSGSLCPLFIGQSFITSAFVFNFGPDFKERTVTWAFYDVNGNIIGSESTDDAFELIIGSIRMEGVYAINPDTIPPNADYLLARIDTDAYLVESISLAGVANAFMTPITGPYEKEKVAV